MIKSYKLDLIDNVIRKIEYVGKQGKLYNFNYADFNKVKKSLDTSNNGIYLIKVDIDSSELYVGQTTQGIKRFDVHKMKDLADQAEIYFYDFGNYSSRNILDYVEQNLITIINQSSYKLRNVSKGIRSDIDNADKQFADEAIQAIINLLQALKINLINTNKSLQEMNIEKNNLDTKNEEENTFFLKGKGFDAKIIRKDELWVLTKGSIVNARVGFKKLRAKQVRFVWKNLFLKNEMNIDNEGLCKSDIVWKSISPLCGLVRGIQAVNGWESMKNSNNKTPDQVYRK